MKTYTTIHNDVSRLQITSRTTIAKTAPLLQSIQAKPNTLVLIKVTTHKGQFSHYDYQLARFSPEKGATFTYRNLDDEIVKASTTAELTHMASQTRPLPYNMTLLTFDDDANLIQMNFDKFQYALQELKERGSGYITAYDDSVFYLSPCSMAFFGKGTHSSSFTDFGMSLAYDRGQDEQLLQLAKLTGF